MQRSNILRLVRCDGFWKAVPWITLLCAVFATVSRNALVLPVYVWVGGFVGMRGCFRSNRFLSSLPFDGRSIFLARFTTAMALLWCPAIAAIVASFVFHAWTQSASGFELLTLAGFYTAMFLLTHAIRTERFVLSESAPALFMFFGFAGLFVVLLLPVAPTAIVEMPVIALLMIRVWKTVPRSFQLVPRPSASLENCLRFLPTWSPACWPILRFVWSGYNVWILPLILFTAGRQSALFFTAIVMPWAWSAFQFRDRWLRTLPISSRRLLRMFMLPVLAAVVVGSYVSLWFGASTVQLRIVSVAVATGLMLFQCILLAYVDRYRSAMFRFAVSIGFLGLLFVAPTAPGRWFFPGDAWIPTLVRASSHVSYLLLLIIAIAILALLYAVLEWVFTGSELRDPFVFRQEKS